MRALIRFAERAERLGARVYVEEPTATFTRLRRLLVADASRASDDGGRGA
jgi:hypothetical protein